MQSPRRDPLSKVDGGFAVWWIVLASILLPVTIVTISIHSALAGKLFGLPSAEYKIYQGPLVAGELWYTLATYVGDPSIQANVRCHIKRLDLQTGAEQDTGFRVEGDSLFPVSLNGEVCGVSHSDIYRFLGQKTEKIRRPSRSSGYFPVPFIYEGQLTEIVETPAKGFRLAHWVDGHWIDGRSILLPGFDRVWSQDLVRDKQVLLPRSTEQPALAAGGARIRVACVQKYEGEYHLFLTDYRRFSAYRKGFEFADEIGDSAASGLRPANAEPEVSGWEPILPDRSDIRWTSMECDNTSLQFMSFTPLPVIARRAADGHWSEMELHEQEKRDVKSRNPNWVLLSNPNEPTSYLVEEEQLWGAARIHRIQENRIQPAHLDLPGGRSAYLKRWLIVIVGIPAAWLIHVLVVVAGLDWGIRHANATHFVYGMQQATIASIRRRAMALIIDCLWIFPLLLLLVYAGASRYGVEWKVPAETELCDRLFQVERSIDEGCKNGRLVPTSTNVWSWMIQSAWFASDREIGIPVVALILLLCAIRPLVRTWFGMTVGEWLTGISRVRSTLRPVDFSRMLLCEAIYCLDFLCLVTPLPAAISICLSHHRQRIGDRLADTMTVRSGSIRTIEPEMKLTRFD